MKTSTQPFIVVATSILLSLAASLANAQASAPAWLQGTNGSIYNPNFSTSGNVGINTNTPWSALDVRTNGTSGTGYYGMNLQNPSTIAYSTIVLNLGTGNSSSVITSQRNNLGSGTYLMFSTSDPTGNAQPKLAISDLGVVHVYSSLAVGTDNNYGYQLAVNGNAIFNKVVVKQYPNWADYVFDSAYKLRPLEKVEQYIRDNHHLPEIPSADSVAKAGINVGDNQVALLKKVEELTLYMIQLNETVKQQQEKIIQLETLLKRSRKNK
jgi:hypothetical protein